MAYILTGSPRYALTFTTHEGATWLISDAGGDIGNQATYYKPDWARDEGERMVALHSDVLASYTVVPVMLAYYGDTDDE